MISGIYFIEAMGCERIKIGYSANLESRIYEMQVGCPFDLELRVVASGPKDVEPAVHHRFRADRVRGEWFLASDELRAFIGQLREGVEVMSLLNSENLRARPLAGANKKLRAHLAGLGEGELRGDIVDFRQRLARV